MTDTFVSCYTQNTARYKSIYFENERKIAVKLSGLTKQDYLSDRIAQRDIVVQGNPRVYKALRDQLSDVLVELKRIDGLDKGRIDEDLLDIIQCISFTLDGLSQDYNKKQGEFDGRIKDYFNG